MAKQKASETSEEERQEAQQTISNIYRTIRELIEEQIAMVEAEGIDFEPEPPPKNKKKPFYS